MNFNNEQLLNLKLKFLQFFRENRINEAHDVAKLMLQIDPKNPIAIKCDNFITLNKQILLENINNDDEQEEQQDEEEIQEQSSSASDEDPVECEEVIEPMWDEELFQKQKEQYLKNIEHIDQSDPQKIKQAIFDAQK